MNNIDAGGNSVTSGYIAAFAAFISSLDVNTALSVGSFILAIGMFIMTWTYRRKEFELKQRRLEHDIRRSKSNPTNG